MNRPVVIGLAGGIGAGKSEVAAILAELGCLVSSSDAEARAVLREPEVRDELVRWWGLGVLGADGHVDRGAVAAIVFADPGQRLRLEALIHPRLVSVRAALIERAGATGVQAVVIDAPLLFEAGVDGECDAVIFVDAPLDVRERRVRESRGWAEGELARRERAQMPLADKRARSDSVIENASDRSQLRARVEAVLAKILRTLNDGRPAGGAGALDGPGASPEP